MAVTTTYRVHGMTCSHCVHAVQQEVSAIDGVTAVSVDLHPGSASVVEVTSDVPVPDQEVVAAVDEAGYELATD